MKADLPQNIAVKLNGNLSQEVQRGLASLCALTYSGNSFTHSPETACAEANIEAFLIKAALEYLGFNEDDYNLTMNLKPHREQGRVQEFQPQNEVLENVISFIKTLSMLEPVSSNQRNMSYRITTTPSLKVLGCADYHVVDFTTALVSQFSGIATRPFPATIEQGSKLRLDFMPSQNAEAFAIFRRLVNKMNDIGIQGRLL